MKKIIVTIIILLVLGGAWFTTRQRKQNKSNPIIPSKIGEKSNLDSTKIKYTLYVSGVDKIRDLEFGPVGTLFGSLMSEGKIIAIPEKDKVVDIITGLQKPHGVAFYKGKLFVAEEAKLSRYNFDEKTLQATFDKKIMDLPAGGRHFTRSIVFDKSGKLFITIGSTCDACFEKNPLIGTVLVTDSDGQNPRIFAKGLRNSVFITVNPKTDELWGTEMGRDWLGDGNPPDEINILKDGRDYGWPVCYGDRVYDKNFGQRDSSYCTNTETPIYKIAAHSAPLGLTFHDDYLYVAYHGSWNRTTPIGYKVVRLKVDGDILGQEETILDFANGDRGRPVDVVFDSQGSLFVSDDQNGTIYKVELNQ